MDTVFKQARQNRAFEDVIFQIQETILQGSLKEGDRLPSERNLREIFKVSRGTLREALRVLEQKGLITIRTGVQGGAIICPVNTKLMRESLELLLRHQKISLRELAEFREEVEGLVAAKAAQKAKKADLQEMETFLEIIKKNLNVNEPNWKEIREEDNKFHLFLARIAGNRVFESILYTVYDNINRYFDQFLPGDVRILKKIYQDLYKIKEAIKERNSTKASDLVRRHIRHFNLMMQEGGSGYIKK